MVIETSQSGSTVGASPARPLATLAAALTVLFGAFVVLGVGLAVAYFWRAGVYDKRAEERLVDQALVSDGEIDAAHAAVTAGSIVWVALAVVTLVVFWTWQFRHAQNARALGAIGGLAHPGWAIGAWLVPGLNIVLGPLQIYRCRAPGVARSTIATRAITWWAIALVLAALAFWLASRVWVDGAEFRFDFIRNSTADYLTSIAALISAVAALCVGYVVRVLSRRQDEVVATRLV